MLQENKLSHFWKDIAKRIFLNFVPYFTKIEHELRNQGFVPIQVENRLTENIAQGMTITGRIDRIDQNKENNQIQILDYKTGAARDFSLGNIEKGIHLQLPLYAYLVRKNYPASEIINAGIYSVLDNDIYWLINKNSKYTISEMISFALRNAQLIIQNIRQGKFDILPMNDSRCNNCEYSSFCPTALNPKPEPESEDLKLFDK